MAYYYMDTDGGSDANGGTSWADAKLTFEGLLGLMSAGDVGYVQGTTVDTTAAARTFTINGTWDNPIKIIGVADGTTNTGSSVTTADLASTLPVIQNTSGNMSFSTSGYGALFYNIEFDCASRINGDFDSLTEWHGCVLKYRNRTFLSTTSAKLIFKDSTLVSLGSDGLLTQAAMCVTEMHGCTLDYSDASAAAALFRSSNAGIATLIGCEILGDPDVQAAFGNAAVTTLIDCKVPAALAASTTFTASRATGRIEMIRCSDTASVASTDSIQDYVYDDPYGTVDLETTIVRTGGADDGASGAFSYAMTPRSSATLEGTNAALASPWLSVWVSGGSNTLTVYICNDTASTDYTKGEVWCEFFTPDASDTAQADLNIDPVMGENVLDNYTAAVTDDTGSTWGTGGNNHQKFSTTVTTGYEGWAYARVHLAKRQATPDTLYLDPKIEVS